jgi:two-component system, chemotaxis family, response regulator Rcp1
MESRRGSGETFGDSLWRGELCAKDGVKFVNARGGYTVPTEVLLVEDSSGDVRLTREAFRDADASIHVHVASDGAEAMAFLKREGSYANAPRPCLILLDLNIPKMNGLEVLGQIKQDPTLQAIPVVILTTSERQADVSRAYELRANCYLNKPVQWDGFSTIVASLNRFWAPELAAKIPAQPA